MYELKSLKQVGVSESDQTVFFWRMTIRNFWNHVVCFMHRHMYVPVPQKSKTKKRRIFQQILYFKTITSWKIHRWVHEHKTPFKHRSTKANLEQNPTSIAPSSLKRAAYPYLCRLVSFTNHKIMHNFARWWFNGWFTMVESAKNHFKQIQDWYHSLMKTKILPNIHLLPKHSHLTRKRRCFTFIRGETYLCLFLAQKWLHTRG